MAIRFCCQRCGQLLSIGSRKAGHRIECPKCGEPLVVPEAQNHDRESPGELAVVSPPATVPEPIEPADPMPPPVVASTVESPPGPSPSLIQAAEILAELHPPATRDIAVPPGMVLVRRRTMHVQSFFFLALAAASFAAGYYAGSLSPSRPAATGVVASNIMVEPTMVEGQVIYENGDGRLRGDLGALVVALPEGKVPNAPLTLAGPGPGASRAANAEQQKSVSRLRDLGGAQARVENKGQFTLLLRPGSYRMLIVSANARRAKGREIDEADAGEMRRLFNSPESLIGPYKYSWGLQSLGAGAPPPSKDFGRDEGH